MDTRLARVYTGAQSAVVGLVAALGGQIIDWLVGHQFSRNLAVAALAVGAITLLQLTNYAVSLALGKFQTFRRVIHGRHYIEGHWFDIVVLKNEKKIREFGLIEIDFENDTYVVSGILFDHQYRRIGDFESTLSSYKENRIEYGYNRVARHGDKTEVASGLGHYAFSREKPHPLTYSGSFHDPEINADLHVIGIRICDKGFVSKIESKEVRSQVEVVKKMALEFIEEFPQYKGEIL